MARMRLTLMTLLVMLVACAPRGDAVAQTTGIQSPVQEAAIVHAPSPLVFEPDHVDIGAVPEGDHAVTFMRVRNTGDQMENIVSVTTSCGCTVARPEQNLLMPNGFTRVKVTVDTFAKQDNVRKWVELTDGEGRRSRGWLSMQVKANPHMVVGKRSIFDGKCGSCHFAPAAGKSSGPAIYAAVCVMCHGTNGQGAYAPKLAGLTDARSLAVLIGAGTGSQHMPGFAHRHGGPLSRRQIAALSQWLSGLDK